MPPDDPFDDDHRPEKRGVAELGRRVLDLSPWQVYDGYVSHQGTESWDTVRGFLRDGVALADPEYDKLVAAMNAQFRARGSIDPLPYSDELG